MASIRRMLLWEIKLGSPIENNLKERHGGAMVGRDRSPATPWPTSHGGSDEGGVRGGRIVRQFYREIGRLLNLKP